MIPLSVTYVLLRFPPPSVYMKVFIMNCHTIFVHEIPVHEYTNSHAIYFSEISDTALAF